MSVEIRNGTTTSVVYVSDGRPATNELFQKADRIQDLFGIVEDAISQKVDKLSVEYDASHGYPKQISIDPHRDAVDEETAYTVSDFRTLR